MNVSSFLNHTSFDSIRAALKPRRKAYLALDTARAVFLQDGRIRWILPAQLQSADGTILHRNDMQWIYSFAMQSFVCNRFENDGRALLYFEELGAQCFRAPNKFHFETLINDLSIQNIRIDNRSAQSTDFSTQVLIGDFTLDKFELLSGYKFSRGEFYFELPQRVPDTLTLSIFNPYDIVRINQPYYTNVSIAQTYPGYFTLTFPTPHYIAEKLYYAPPGLSFLSGGIVDTFAIASYSTGNPLDDAAVASINTVHSVVDSIQTYVRVGSFGIIYPPENFSTYRVDTAPIDFYTTLMDNSAKSVQATIGGVTASGYLRFAIDSSFQVSAPGLPTGGTIDISGASSAAASDDSVISTINTTWPITTTRTLAGVRHYALDIPVGFSIGTQMSNNGNYPADILICDTNAPNPTFGSGLLYTTRATVQPIRDTLRVVFSPTDAINADLFNSYIRIQNFANGTPADDPLVSYINNTAFAPGGNVGQFYAARVYGPVGTFSTNEIFADSGLGYYHYGSLAPIPDGPAVTPNRITISNATATFQSYWTNTPVTTGIYQNAPIVTINLAYNTFALPDKVDRLVSVETSSGVIYTNVLLYMRTTAGRLFFPPTFTIPPELYVSGTCRVRGFTTTATDPTSVNFANYINNTPFTITYNTNFTLYTVFPSTAGFYSPAVIKPTDSSFKFVNATINATPVNNIFVRYINGLFQVAMPAITLNSTTRKIRFSIGIGGIDDWGISSFRTYINNNDMYTNTVEIIPGPSQFLNLVNPNSTSVMDLIDRNPKLSIVVDDGSNNTEVVIVPSGNTLNCYNFTAIPFNPSLYYTIMAFYSDDPADAARIADILSSSFYTLYSYSYSLYTPQVLRISTTEPPLDDQLVSVMINGNRYNNTRLIWRAPYTTLWLSMGVVLDDTAEYNVQVLDYPLTSSYETSISTTLLRATRVEGYYRFQYIPGISSALSTLELQSILYSIGGTTRRVVAFPYGDFIGIADIYPVEFTEAKIAPRCSSYALFLDSFTTDNPTVDAALIARMNTQEFTYVQILNATQILIGLFDELPIGYNELAKYKVPIIDQQWIAQGTPGTVGVTCITERYTLNLEFEYE